MAILSLDVIVEIYKLLMLKNQENDKNVNFSHICLLKGQLLNLTQLNSFEFCD